MDRMKYILRKKWFCPLNTIWITNNFRLSLGGASGEEPACQFRRHKIQVHSVGREDPPEEGMATHSCLENPMDRGDWQAAVHRVTKSQTWLKWHSTHTPFLSAHCHSALTVFRIRGSFDKPYCFTLWPSGVWCKKLKLSSTPLLRHQNKVWFAP